MATKLGGILTMEAIIRTIEPFGSKELSPEVKSFFQHSPDVARPYVASVKYITDAMENHKLDWLKMRKRAGGSDRIGDWKLRRKRIVELLFQRLYPLHCLIEQGNQLRMGKLFELQLV